MIGERLGITEQFQGVDELKVQDDGSLDVRATRTPLEREPGQERRDKKLLRVHLHQQKRIRMWFRTQSGNIVLSIGPAPGKRLRSERGLVHYRLSLPHRRYRRKPLLLFLNPKSSVRRFGVCAP